jgi:hypothetical protein
MPYTFVAASIFYNYAMNVRRFDFKMKITRRIFIQASAWSLLGTISHSVGAAPAMPIISSAPQRGYVLTNGATALKRDDGTWMFWVRIVNLDQPDTDVAANLQIATDTGFTQIIDALPIALSASNSFIAQIPYKPRTNTLLYYRYVVGRDASAAPNVSSVVNSIAPWDNQSRAQ